jgi:hypothetical protein
MEYVCKETRVFHENSIVLVSNNNTYQKYLLIIHRGEAREFVTYVSVVFRRNVAGP